MLFLCLSLETTKDAMLPAHSWVLIFVCICCGVGSGWAVMFAYVRKYFFALHFGGFGFLGITVRAYEEDTTKRPLESSSYVCFLGVFE